MSEWHTETLGELADAAGGVIRTGPFGSQLHRHEYVDGGEVAVVMPKDMIDGRIASNSIARIDRDTAARLAEHLLRPADIVLARRGDIGRAAWVHPRDGAVICGTGSMRIHIPDGKIAPRYLHYFLQAGGAAAWLQSQAVGATMPNLNADIVRGLPVRYPHPQTQKIIIEILDSVDDLIENNRLRIALLEQMAQATYREWFVHFRYRGHEDDEFVDSPLGPIPAGWQVRPLFEVADVGFGFALKSKGFGPQGAWPVIRIRDVPNGLTPTCTDEFPGDRYIVYDGDTLIGMDGDFHMSRWSGGAALLNQRVTRIRPKGDLGAEALYQALRAPIREWNERIVGTTVAHLGKRHLEEITLVVPPPVVARKLDNVLDTLGDLVLELRRVNTSLRDLRDLLLPKLVTGAIDVSHLDLDALLEETAA